MGTPTPATAGMVAWRPARKLNQPLGVAVDGSGNLYIADHSNNVIRKVTPGGTIATFAGNGTSGFSRDGGAATSAELSDHIANLAADSVGNLYIADDANERIRKVSYGPETQAAAPTFSPAAGTYPTAQSVTISSGTAGASVYYTTQWHHPDHFLYGLCGGHRSLFVRDHRGYRGGERILRLSGRHGHLHNQYCVRPVSHANGQQFRLHLRIGRRDGDPDRSRQSAEANGGRLQLDHLRRLDSAGFLRRVQHVQRLHPYHGVC